MMETADNVAGDYGITREECDEYAVRSQKRAAAAWAEGKFDNEMVPVPVPQKKGDPLIFARDEGIRSDSSVESLAKLRPVHSGGVTTAGNASQQNDAASACLVVAADKLDELKLDPMAWFVNWAVAGCEPSRMGLGPVPAVEKLMKRTGLTLDDMDLVELNEAFAAQVLGVLKGWGWNDPDKLNPNGSGISLGHPIGATGGRILATMLNELQRRQGRYALETMCIGGGQGIAALFERA
jgi:acetyl-CoA C-acetyltransferase